MWISESFPFIFLYYPATTPLSLLPVFLFFIAFFLFHSHFALNISYDTHPCLHCLSHPFALSIFLVFRNSKYLTPRGYTRHLGQTKICINSKENVTILNMGEVYKAPKRKVFNLFLHHWPQLCVWSLHPWIRILLGSFPLWIPLANSHLNW